MEKLNNNYIPIAFGPNCFSYSANNILYMCNIKDANDQYYNQYEIANKGFILMKYGFLTKNDNEMVDLWAFFKKIKMFIKKDINLFNILINIFDCIKINNKYSKKKKYLIFEYFENEKFSKFLETFGWFNINSKKNTNYNLISRCKNLESKEKYTRSCALAFMHFEFKIAKIALIMFKKKRNNLDKEIDMMLGILDLLIEIEEEKKIDEDVIKVKLNVILSLFNNIKFEDANLELILSFLKNDDGKNIIKNDDINIFDRLIYLLRFNNNKCIDYLMEIMEKWLKDGKLYGIILSANNLNSINYLKNYYDKTDDLLTSGCISILMKNLIFRELNEKESINSYHNDKIKNLKEIENSMKKMLNKWGFFNLRISIDKEIYEMNKEFDKKKKLDVHDCTKISCYYCKSILNFDYKNKPKNAIKFKNDIIKVNKLISNICGYCGKKLPNCSICLLPIQLYNPLEINLKSQIKNPISLFSKSITWCQSCMHGGHNRHIEEWFSDNDKCPVSSCNCLCKYL